MLARQTRLTRGRIVLVALMLAMAVLPIGCDTGGVTLVDEGRAYSMAEMDTLLEHSDSGTLSTVSSDVIQRRREALISLRQQGAVGGQAADLITSQFPAETYGVPFYVERATVDGVPSWLVIEAIGRPGGPLGDRRLWVLDDTGSVSYSATR